MTPLVALVVVVVGAMLVGGLNQPSETAAPSAASSGESVALTRSGDFELVIRAGKVRYSAGEPIEITAQLRYVGPGTSIEIGHAAGAHGSAIGFGILEPVIGDFRVGTGWDLSCSRSTLTPDAPIIVPFQKGGGWSSDDPRADEYRAFLADPVLRLPTGFWHVLAVAEFSIGDCGGETVQLRVEIPVEVVPDLPASTHAAAGAVGPSDVVRDGAFTLGLEATKARYAPNEAIDVVGTLLFDGPQDAITFRHDSSGPIVFGIREPVFGEITAGGISILMWENTTLQRAVPFVAPFAKGGAMIGDHPDAALHMAWMEDPVFWLPEGTWHLYAVAEGGNTTIGGFSLTAEIEIVVDDDPAATPGHPEATEYPFKPVYGGADIGGIALQLKSERPVYEVGTAVELSVWYWFMEGGEVVASHFQPEVALTIEQLDATDPQVRGITYDSSCTDLGVVTGQERHVEIGPGLIVLLRADEAPTRFEDFFVDGELRLPVGRWRISASVAGEFGPCSGDGEPYEISTSLEIQVVETLK